MEISSLPFIYQTDDLIATPTQIENPDYPESDLCDTRQFDYIPGFETVWYRFTPTSTIRVHLDTIESNYDTFMVIWTGSWGNLTEVACNNNTVAPNTTTPIIESAIDITLQAGVTYYIEVMLTRATQQASSSDFSSQSSGKKHVFRMVPLQSATFRSQGTYDGWVLESAENSNQGGTINNSATTLRLGDDAARKQYRSILSFNTSSLPDDAVIQRVLLKLRHQGITGTGNPINLFGGIFAEIRKGPFGTYPALQLTDWQAQANVRLGPFKPSLSSGWYTLNLSNGRAAINRTTSNSGVTQIRLRFRIDDNNDGVANYLSLYSGNAGTVSQPQLFVEYYLP